MHLQELETVFTEYQRQLFVVALAITRNRELAEDAVHDGLLAVAAVTTGISDVKAYLFRTVRNRALHLISTAARHTELEEDYLDEAGIQPENQHFVDQVRAGIGTLESDERQTLMLKLFEGLTFAEIAEVTENSPNTVASWYRRGLEKLKEKLDV